MNLNVLLLACAAASVWFCSHGFAQQPAAGKQVQMEYTASDGGKVKYLLYLPKEYQNGGDAKFPLIYFLHGRGESYGPLSLVAKWGPPMMAARGDELPYIVVSPQCPEKDSWTSDTQQQRLLELLNETEKKFQVDRQSIFLTGLSMGGYGTWKMAAAHPDRFAAAVPICGGGDPADAEIICHRELVRAIGDHSRRDLRRQKISEGVGVADQQHEGDLV